MEYDALKIKGHTRPSPVTGFRIYWCPDICVLSCEIYERRSIREAIEMLDSKANQRLESLDRSILGLIRHTLRVRIEIHCQRIQFGEFMDSAEVALDKGRHPPIIGGDGRKAGKGDAYCKWVLRTTR